MRLTNLRLQTVSSQSTALTNLQQEVDDILNADAEKAAGLEEVIEELERLQTQEAERSRDLHKAQQEGQVRGLYHETEPLKDSLAGPASLRTAIDTGSRMQHRFYVKVHCRHIGSATTCAVLCRHCRLRLRICSSRRRRVRLMAVAYASS